MTKSTEERLARLERSIINLAGVCAGLLQNDREAALEAMREGWPDIAGLLSPREIDIFLAAYEKAAPKQ